MLDAALFDRASLLASSAGSSGRGRRRRLRVGLPTRPLRDGARLGELAAEVRGVHLPDGRVVPVAGEAMILADILDMVSREGWQILLAAATAVVLALWASLGRLRTALLCLAPTAASVAALFGLLPLTGSTFNYLNIVAIPVLIGVTVDASVHLLSRMEAPEGTFHAAYGETGRAIARAADEPSASGRCCSPITRASTRWAGSRCSASRSTWSSCWSVSLRCSGCAAGRGRRRRSPESGPAGPLEVVMRAPLRAR
jgi:hypothetical protein